MPAALSDFTDATDHWHALHLQQSDWALRAYDRLVSTLGEDVQKKLRNTTEAVQPYVVIFGTTQVGKTTLLLDLMGVLPEQMTTISEVLRGGREAGNSATATAMEYVRSPTEEWGLDLPGSASTQWLDSDEAVSAALGQLRDEMENGQLTAHAQPCVVRIPQRFFDSTPSAAHQIRILDLPGDSPANEVEQQHVERMAQTYLPFADLILLVFKGEGLTDLPTGGITLPGIEDWQAMPHRFRVVTTHSCSAKSIKDLVRSNIRNCIPIDATLLRQRLLEEIKRPPNTLRPEADDQNLYFPLESSVGLQYLAQKEQDLYNHVSPVIVQLRTELLQVITNVATPMGRLRSIWDAHHRVRDLHRIKISRIEQQRQELEKKTETITEEIDSWAESIKKAENNLKNLNDELSKNPLREGGKIINAACLNLPKNYPPTVNGDKNCEALREMLREYRRLLKSSSLTPEIPSPYWRKVQREFQEPDLEFIQNLIDDELSSVRAKLDSYWFDKYFSTSSYESDKADVVRASSEAEKKLTQLWRVAWTLSLQEVDQQLHKRKIALEFQVAIHNNEKRNSIKTLTALQASLVSLDNEQIRIEHNTQEDLQRCEQLDKFLDEEYFIALDRKVDEIFTINDDCDALLQLLHCVELKYQHAEFITLNQTNKKPQQ